MKKLQFLKIFNKFSRFFQKLIENYIEFLAKLWEKIRKFRNMHLYGIGGRNPPPPDDSEFMEIWVEKSMKTWNFWIVLMEIFPFFQNL